MYYSKAHTSCSIYAGCVYQVYTGTVLCIMYIDIIFFYCFVIVVGK